MKVVTPILIGFAVAFVIGFGMQAFLAWAKAPPDFMATWLPAAIFGAIAAYVAGNLAGNRKVAAASDADRQAALSFTAPAGQARVYVFREGFVGMAAGLNVTMDGRPISQLKAPRFTSVAVEPGVHTLQVAFGGLAGPQNAPAQEELRLSAGDLAAVRATISMGALKNTLTLQRVNLDDALRAKLSRMTMTAADGLPGPT